ncbi:MAG: DUF2961 domain-containing protein [Candidatus Hydrogenedentes bacterium]|nr:DUF2961 domain-containing protein [Candidatus Hydrogenedentota bacterium]
MRNVTRGMVGAILCGAMVSAVAMAAGLQNNDLAGIATLKEGRSQRASSSDANWRDGNGDARPIEPGGTLVLADLKGPGVINHFWNTIASSERGYSRLLVLRMYWDGETEPSVECPIGDFFGIGHGLDVPYDSEPMRVSSDGRGRNCYWPMPFRKAAKITVTNEGRLRTDAFYYYLDWQQVPRLGRNTAYFHAMYRQEFPAVMGKNYLLAEITGRGQYVGTVLSCRQRTASWWGEGDDFFFIDGEKEPSLRGTGTEDYYCDGWGFRKQNGMYYGAPLVEGYEPGNRTSVYRWHIPDPVIFHTSLHVEIEHKGVTLNPDGKIKSGFEERPDDLSSVAFWYQTEPHKQFAKMPVGYERLHTDYSKAIESEVQIPNAKATQGPVTKQEIGGASGGAQLFWMPSMANQTLTIPFEAKEAGDIDLTLLLVYSWDYGIYEFQLDGKPLGQPVDMYNASVTVREKTIFPSMKLEAGAHTLTVVNRGKNEASKGYFCGVDGILLSKQRAGAAS